MKLGPLRLQAGITSKQRIQSELPFVIGVLADFSGMPQEPLPSPSQRRFVDVDLNNLDRALEACRPCLQIKVANKLSDDANAGYIAVELKFRTLRDFNPGEICAQIGPLRKLLDLKQRLVDIRDTLQSNSKLDEVLQEAFHSDEKLTALRIELEAPAPVQESPRSHVESDGIPRRSTFKTSPESAGSGLPRESTPTPARETKLPEKGVWSAAKPSANTSLLEKISLTIPDEMPERERKKDLVKEFVAQVLSGDVSVSRDSETMINSRLAQIDHLVSLQLREVLHEPRFQVLEARWRGLHFLLRRTRKAAHVKVRILNISKKDLFREFDRARSGKDSALARKVLDRAGASAGQAPFTLLMGDYDFGRHYGDVDLLAHLARMGSEAHTPFVASASWDLLGVPSFHDLDASELTETFKASEYGKWNHFSAGIHSRYVGLTIPRLLMRLPYGRPSNPVEAFNFEEGVNGSDSSTFLWGSAAWALAARCAADFERYGWFGMKRSADDHQYVSDLPVSVHYNDDGDVSETGPLEVAFDENRYAELRALGLAAFMQTNGGRMFAWEIRSCHRPETDSDTDPPETYESADIECMLSVSHLAHCLQAALRAQLPHLCSIREAEEFIAKWSASFVASGLARTASFRSSFPFLNASFRIERGRPARRNFNVLATVLPDLAAGTLPYPVEISIPVVLPMAFGWAEKEEAGEAPELTSANNEMVIADTSLRVVSGREAFISGIYMAEACIKNRKMDIAMLILEELSEQIDRHRLAEWEAPGLVTQVWDLLRRCCLLVSESSPQAQERAEDLLKRIRKLDPTKRRREALRP